MKYLLKGLDRLAFTLFMSVVMVVLMIYYPVVTIIRFCWDFKIVKLDVKEFIDEFLEGLKFKKGLIEEFSKVEYQQL